MEVIVTRANSYNNKFGEQSAPIKHGGRDNKMTLDILNFGDSADNKFVKIGWRCYRR